MNTAFDKLRLSSPARRGAAVVALCAAGALAAGKANAVTINATGFTTTVGGVVYTSIGRNSTVDTPLTLLPGATGGQGYGLTDASLTASGQGDAFDDFGGITVNGKAFNQPGGVVDRTFTSDGMFLTTLTPENIDGIDTSLDYFADDSSPTLRVFSTFTNTNQDQTTFDVAYGGDLGCDSSCIIEDSSNGDAIFDQATDRFIVVSDGGPFDPVLTFVRFGEGGLAPTSTPAVPGQSFSGSFDVLGDVYTLTLDPDETVSLLYFVHFNVDVADATSDSATFANLTTLGNDGLLVGLSQQQLA